MPEHTNIEEMRDLAAEVVISGLSGRLPESDNIAEFREHLINAEDMVTEDDRRWEPGELKFFVYCIGQVFSIGTVAAYSAKYSTLVAYKILELFQY